MLGGLLGLVGLSAIAGVLVTATITPAIAVSSYAGSSAISLFESLPANLQVDRPMEPTTIYANRTDGEGYYELASFYDQNREPVEYGEVSQFVYDALLSTEDPRYYEHGGVDLIGTSRALLSNAAGGATQGGSSISQQYVKNVLVQECEREATTSEENAACYEDATTAAGTEGYKRKLQEMRYAIAIEQEYSKEQILIAYLNLANFGGTTYGIEAAAQHYFSTSAKDLSLTQAATLAGIVNFPNTLRIDLPNGSTQNADGELVNSAEDGYAVTKNRRDHVLYRMLDEGTITQDQYDAAVAEPVEPKITWRDEGCAASPDTAYFCQYVKNTILYDERYNDTFGEITEEQALDDNGDPAVDDNGDPIMRTDNSARSDTLYRGGLEIYTTLDSDLQWQANETMKNHVPQSVDFMDLGSTTVQLKADTGEILSMAQNTEFTEQDGAGDGQSSLVYAAGYEHGRSSGFPAGSTYKIFTILDWLQNGRSVNERVDARVGRPLPMSCNGENVGSFTPVREDNYLGQAAGIHSVRDITGMSLNSGFYAMASQLDVCEIHGVAASMGLTFGNGAPLTGPYPGINGDYPGPFSVIGSFNVAPLDMASVYATVANGGVRCEPTAIRSVVDADGEDLPMPENACERVLDENVAATAAFDLARVMEGGFTGSTANTGDGVPTFGKTGTHEFEHTWMIQSSSNVTTAAWLGNANGNVKFQHAWAISEQMTSVRYALSRENQAAANAKYGGEAFPEPDEELTKVIEADVPNVAGMWVGEATSRLEAAGFQVRVAEERVDGVQDEGRVESTDPGPGKAPRGSLVTIHVSNGDGTKVPDVSGSSPARAIAQLVSDGLRGTLGECTESDSAPGRGTVTGTDPGAGEAVAEGTTVRVNYEARNCRGGGDD